MHTRRPALLANYSQVRSFARFPLCFPSQKPLILINMEMPTMYVVLFFCCLNSQLCLCYCLKTRSNFFSGGSMLIRPNARGGTIVTYRCVVGIDGEQTFQLGSSRCPGMFQNAVVCLSSRRP